MSSVPVDVLDYYDAEVVRRIIEKYGYGERDAFEQFIGLPHACKSGNGDVAVRSGGTVQHLGKRESHRLAEELGLSEDGVR